MIKTTITFEFVAEIVPKLPSVGRDYNPLRDIIVAIPEMKKLTDFCIKKVSQEITEKTPD